MRVSEIVGHRLRQARQEIGMSQAAMAEHLRAFGLRWWPQTVSSAEKGEREFPAEELYTIAFALERPVSAFFEAPPDVREIELPMGPVKVRKQSLQEMAQDALRIARALQAGGTTRNLTVGSEGGEES